MTIPRSLHILLAISSALERILRALFGWLLCACSGHPSDAWIPTGETLDDGKHKRCRCSRCGWKEWR
jgi:hypothetical protein